MSFISKNTQNCEATLNKNHIEIEKIPYKDMRKHYQNSNVIGKTIDKEEFNSLRKNIKLTCRNEGSNNPETLLQILHSVYSIDLDILEKDIKAIDNHKGAWTIIFNSIPSPYLLMSIHTVFQSVFCYDGLWFIVFIDNNGKELIFENCSGTHNMDNVSIFTAVSLSINHVLNKSSILPFSTYKSNTTWDDWKSDKNKQEL